MPTKIVFSGGSDIVVKEEPPKVSTALTKALQIGEVLVLFQEEEGPVEVAPAHVVYIKPEGYPRG